LSPAGLYVSLIDHTADGIAGSGLFIASLVMAALLLGAALLLYRIYPSETAGNALAFPRTAPVFKVMICIPAALFSSIIAKLFMGVTGTKWIIVLSLLAAVILCGVIEFIYQQDLEIDRQHHTIPNQRKQRPKDKHCGNVHNRLWNHG